jgi:hypothetical protein
MNSDNPPGRNAHGPDTEADYADPFIDILASKSKIESSKAEKKPTGVAVGKKKDADADRDREVVSRGRSIP